MHADGEVAELDGAACARLLRADAELAHFARTFAASGERGWRACGGAALNCCRWSWRPSPVTPAPPASTWPRSIRRPTG